MWEDTPSQSLFYWNPFCNDITINWSNGESGSQSLFYWNPFCNIFFRLAPEPSPSRRNPYFIGILSAMKQNVCSISLKKKCRNPYFIGILSAIVKYLDKHNFRFSRNPYFIGILSAIAKLIIFNINNSSRNPYFIGILSAIKNFEPFLRQFQKSQSLFYWNPFCNTFLTFF